MSSTGEGEHDCENLEHPAADTENLTSDNANGEEKEPTPEIKKRRKRDIFTMDSKINSITKYNGANYDQWRPQIEHLLQCSRQLKHCLRARRKPKKEDPEESDDEGDDRDSALGTIFLTMNEEMESRYSSIKDPKQLWDKLTEDNKAKINMSHHIYRKELITLKYEDHKDLDALDGTISKLCGKMTECGISIPDNEKVFHLWNALPQTPEWETYVSAIEAANPNIEYVDFLERLKHQEWKLQIQGKTVDSNAVNRITGNRGHGRGRGGKTTNEDRPSENDTAETRKCRKCGKIGHVAKDCRKKNADKSESNANRIECYFCGMKGHTEDKCHRKKHFSKECKAKARKATVNDNDNDSDDVILSKRLHVDGNDSEPKGNAVGNKVG